MAHTAWPPCEATGRLTTTFLPSQVGVHASTGDLAIRRVSCIFRQ